MIGSTTPPGDDRADERCVGACRRAMRREPDVDPLVRRADAAGLDHVSDEKPERDRKRSDHDQAAEHHQEENDDRMAVGERAEPLGEPAVTRPEDGRRPLLLRGGAAKRHSQDVF